MSLLNIKKIAACFLMFGAIASIAMEPQWPYTFEQMFSEIQRMRQEHRSYENYLAQLPVELRNQLSNLINQELLEPLRAQTQNDIRKFLHNRIWADLSDHEKLNLLTIIIIQHPHALPANDWELLSLISRLLRLKGFSGVANSQNSTITIINKLGLYTNLNQFDIAVGLNTPVSIQWIKRQLLREEGPDRIITDRLIDLFTFLFQKKYDPTFIAQMIKIYIAIASKMRLNFDFDVNFGQEKKGTLLTNAIKNNAPYEIIKLLIENGADVNKRTAMGTPLAIAQQTADLDARIIPLLLEHGATIEGNPSQEARVAESEEEEY